MEYSPFWPLPVEISRDKFALADYRYLLFAHWASICGIVTHFALIIVFFYIGLNIMAYVNIGSVALFTYCLYLAHKRSNYLLLGILMVSEINIHAALAVYFVGWESGFQFFILLVPVGVFFLPIMKLASMSAVLVSMSFFATMFLLLRDRTPLYQVSPSIIGTFNLSVGLSTLLILGIIAYAFSLAVDFSEKLLKIQHKNTEGLLHNILPISVTERLKEQKGIIADGFTDVSILFADLQSFTEYSDTKRPEDLVFVLNNYFSIFDDMLEQYSMEKIKTIGDAYMVACGCPDECKNHAEKAVDFALAMLAATWRFNRENDINFSLRIGINSGPVTAGIIGKKKYAYDLWGDTVNVASRMETSGLPGKIHITENTYRMINGKYEVIKRNPILIKGKGLMQTYFVKANQLNGRVIQL